MIHCVTLPSILIGWKKRQDYTNQIWRW